jgi:hypothetical protein
MLLVAPQICSAQKKDLKQFVTVSLSGYDDLMKGVALIGKLSGVPLLQMIEGQLQATGAADALESIDKKRPWVVAVKTDNEGNEFVVQGFLPTSDVKKFLRGLPMLGEPGDAGDGVLEIRTPFRSVFAKQHGNWAMLGDSKQSVADAPADPLKSVGSMPEKYQLGVSFSMKDVPEALRQKYATLFMLGVQSGMGRRPNESDEQFAARSKMIQSALEQMKATLADIDALTVGIKLDDATSSAYLEYVLTVVPGSKTAERMAKGTEVKTSFAGAILPDAAISFHAAQKFDPADIAQLKSSVALLRTNAMAELEKQGLQDEQLKLAKQMASDLMDVVDKTLDAGKMDMAASAKLGPKVVTVVAGAQIAEGGKLESVLKRLVQQIAKDQPDAAKFFKLDAEEHQGVRFHVLSVPISAMGGEGQEKAAALVGESLDVVIGIGEKSLYLAAGRDAAKTLKQVLDECKSAGEKSLPPMQLTVAAGAIAKFAAAMADEDERPDIERVAKVLESSDGKDRLKLTATQIPNGAQVRLEAEEGILKLLGAMPGMGGAVKVMPPAKAKGGKAAKKAAKAGDAPEETEVKARKKAAKQAKPKEDDEDK